MAQSFLNGKGQSEQRPLGIRITVWIRIIVERITDSGPPSIETGAVSFPQRHTFQAFRVSGG